MGVLEDLFTLGTQLAVGCLVLWLRSGNDSVMRTVARRRGARCYVEKSVTFALSERPFV